MTVRPKLFRLYRRAGLTAEQIQMYSQERMMNFRWISRILSTYSSHIISPSDAVSNELAQELSELGQFAEVSYSTIPADFIFANLAWMLEEDFPLEGYYALRESILVSSIRGKVANLGAFVAYRPTTKQLVVSISGTANIKQAFQDVRTTKRKHPVGQGCSVHVGFWKMYNGIKSEVISALKKGLREHEVLELVLTGHSMGGALSHLLAVDLLAPGCLDVPHGLIIKLVIFGAPRSGNPKLSQFWVDLLKDYRSKHGEDSFKEYSVKAYKDGVPSLPPKFFGFRHFALQPFYLSRGRLYYIPQSEAEYSLFHISADENEKELASPYPRGGHNYYLRDMEKYHRRMLWVEKMMSGDDTWKERYKEKVARRERGQTTDKRKESKEQDNARTLTEKP